METKTYRSNSTWFLHHLDPILRNDFSCRYESTEKPIIAVTDPRKSEPRVLGVSTAIPTPPHDSWRSHEAEKENRRWTKRPKRTLLE